MNRRGKLLFSVTALLALLALLAACGGGGGEPERDVRPPDASDGGERADVGADSETPDDVPVGEDESQPDTFVRDVPEPDVPTPRCTDDEDCVGQLEGLTPCQDPVCDDGTCVASDRVAAPGCCETDEECAALVTEEGKTGSCPTPGAACVVADDCRSAAAPDAFCAEQIANENACEVPTCDADSGACEKVRTPPFVGGATAGGCCLTAAECDDGDPNTTCTCPGIGGECVCEVPPVCSDDDDPDQWCADNNPPAGTCAEWTCNQDTDACEPAAVEPPNCCIAAGDCDDGNECTQDSCPSIGGRCQYVFICSCSETIRPWEATFDGGTLDDLQIFDWNESDFVTWQPVTKNAYKGYSIYLGDPSCEWYFNGDEVDANCETPYSPIEDEDGHAGQIYVELVSPIINLDRQDLAWMLGFWVAGKSQPPDPTLPAGLPQADTLTISIADTDTGIQTPVFESSDYNNDIPTPTYVAADLTAYTGKAIQIHILFDSQDGRDNRWPGYWLDELEVRTFCGPIQCEDNDDCLDDNNGCTQDVCTRFEGGGPLGVCARNIFPIDCIGCDPAGDGAECDSGDECILGTCSDEGVCEFAPSGSAACCNADDILDTTFDGGALPAGWTVEDDGGPVTWQVVSDPEAGMTSLYFGDPATGTYDNGNDPAWGRVTTGVVELPDPAVTPFLYLVSSWQLRLSTEWEAEPNFLPGQEVDRASLYIAYTDDVGAEAELAIWTSDAVEGTTNGDWVGQGVDLTAYAGRSVRFIFEFDSYDELGNTYGGAWIDDFSVRTICGEICDDPSDCDDGDACTLDQCNALVCENPLAYVDCCTAAADCGQGNACTTVTCGGIGANPDFPQAGTCSFRDDGVTDTCCDDNGGVTTVNDIPVEDLAGAGYVIEATDYGDVQNAVVWHASEACALSEPYGLYFGDDLFESYQSGFPVGGSVTTPPVPVPSSGAAAKSWLEFELFLDTEWANAVREGWVNPPSIIRDHLELYAVQGGNEVLLWSSFEIDFRGSTCLDNAPCDWLTVRVDLTGYQGSSPRLKWVFDSVDDISNGGKGVCIDDIRVVTDCQGQAELDCFRSEDCDDDDPCTFDFCHAQTPFACTFPSTGDPTCCADQELVAYDWDTGTAEGWSFSDPVETVGWTVADFTTAASGSHFLYFGDPVAQDYDVTGQTVGGDAWSPTTELPPIENVESLTLTFAYYLDVEEYSAQFQSRDTFEVWIVDNQSAAEDLLVDKRDLDDVGVQPPTWNTFEADIPTSFAGALVSFEIRFSSGDAEENTGLGVLVDSFRVSGVVCP